MYSYYSGKKKVNKVLKKAYRAKPSQKKVFCTRRALLAQGIWGVLRRDTRLGSTALS